MKSRTSNVSGLNLWRRLLLVGVTGAVPLFIVSLVLIKWFYGGSINFALQEQKGIAFQRPLEQLLDLFPRYQAAARQTLAGEGSSSSKLADLRRQIDSSMDAFAANYNGDLGRALKFTDAELASRKLDNARLSVLQENWKILENAPPAEAARDDAAGRCVASVRAMITHAGDISNLILDDNLDSYYLMDITLCALPQTQQRLGDITLQVGDWLRNGQEASNKTPIAMLATMLQQNDQDRIARDAQVSLNEDKNYYGTSESLQKNLPPALAKYTGANEAVLALLTRIVAGGKVPAVQLEAAGWNARAESFRLWQTGADELDRLISMRIHVIQQKRLHGYMIICLTLVLAAAAMGWIISGLLNARYAEMMKTEEELRSQEARLRMLGEASFEGITLCTDDILSDANDQFLKMFGYTRSEMLGMNVMNLIAPESIGLVRRMIDTAHDSPYEFVAIRKDGTRFPAEVSGRTLATDPHRLRLTALRDITEQKRAQAELIWKTAFLEAQVNSALDGILVVGSQGGKILQNQRMSDLWKIPPHIAADPDDTKQVRFVLDQIKYPRPFAEKIAHLYAHPDETSIDEIELADGSVFERYSAPVRGSDGKHYGRVWTFHDITGSRQREEALKHSEERFSRMFQSNPVPIILVRQGDSIILDANEGFLSMSGFTREEVIGRTSLDLKLYPDPGKRAFVLEQLREHGHLHGHDQLFQTKSGQIRDTVLWLDGIKINGEQCFLVSILDITERKRAEEIVREKQAQLILAMDIAKLAHWEFDVAANLVTGDEHIFQLFGTTPEKEGGFSMSPEDYIRKFVHPADAGLVANEVAMGVSTTDPDFARQFEHRIIRADKTEGVMMVRSRVVLGDAGRTVKIHGTNQDITDSRKLEAQFRQAQKMEAIGQLASGVAHDFNNILAVISMQAGLLGNDGGLTPMQTELLTEMEGAVQRAADLTRQLLLFSRRQTMQPRDLDLNAIVINVSKMLQRILGENIENKFIGSLQPLYVNADAGMMDQVLMNLTVNARDAMPDGGRLVVETSAMEFDELAASQVSQARAGSFACVSVSDSGCGIPPENMQRIFEPFFTTKDVGKGTGLGLATVFGIVQQHQGWINIYSEVGHGTVFRIYLPRIAEGSEKETAASVPTSTFAGNETILVVEDDPSLRVAVRTALFHLGYRVLEAATGPGAIEAWDESRDEIRLLLTDLMLPGGMNGKQLARRLLEEKPALKVLYTSGYSAEVAGKDLPLEEGVNFLTKPFSAHKLAQTIRAKLDA
jgi:PAS domain S-box-containing protein